MSTRCEHVESRGSGTIEQCYNDDECGHMYMQVAHPRNPISGKNYVSGKQWITIRRITTLNDFDEIWDQCIHNLEN